MDAHEHNSADLLSVPMLPNHCQRSVWIFVALCTTSCERAPEIGKGDEIYAIAEDAVLAVTIRAPGRRAEARRKTPEQPFTYSFERHGSRSEHCPADATIDAALAPIHSVRVKDVLSRDEAGAYTSGNDHEAWVELEVDDIMTDVTPYRLRLVRDASDASRLLARNSPNGVVFAVSSELVSLLEQHCPPR